MPVLRFGLTKAVQQLIAIDVRFALFRVKDRPALGGTRGALDGRTWACPRSCPRHVPFVTITQMLVRFVLSPRQGKQVLGGPIATHAQGPVRFAHWPGHGRPAIGCTRTMLSRVMSVLRFGMAKAGQQLLTQVRRTPGDISVLRFGMAKAGQS